MSIKTSETFLRKIRKSTSSLSRNLDVVLKNMDLSGVSAMELHGITKFRDDSARHYRLCMWRNCVLYKAGRVIVMLLGFNL